MPPGLPRYLAPSCLTQVGAGEGGTCCLLLSGLSAWILGTPPSLRAGDTLNLRMWAERVQLGTEWMEGEDTAVLRGGHEAEQRVRPGHQGPAPGHLWGQGADAWGSEQAFCDTWQQWCWGPGEVTWSTRPIQTPLTWLHVAGVLLGQGLELPGIPSFSRGGIA